MRKKFPCGHKGKGKYCHRCAQDKVIQVQKEQLNAEKKQHRQDWIESFKHDPIDLSTLNHYGKKLVLYARKIIAEIQNGKSHTKYKGKRLRYDRNVISIPINNDYRLLLHETNDGLKIDKLLSHEEYNRRKPGHP